ncbi:MAG TPA: glycosyltransferase [Burkholderiaceae bacterium]|jgi:UDP:flavonoid glycosyltransferase YjiC (YdhE family)
MRILIATVGSHGDVLPFIALGRELQRRGHDVRFYADKTFESLVSEAALHFTPIAAGDKYRDSLQNPDITDPIKGMRMVAEGTAEYAPMFYQAMYRDIELGRTVVIGSTLAFGARLLREKHHIPTVIAHFAPSVLRSEYLAPRFSPIGHMEHAPRFVKRFIWSAMDKRFLDPLYTVPFNRIRHDLGLPPVKRIWHGWIHEADLLLGLFPEWFAERQSDWPAALQLTGFPLDDHGKDAPLPDELNAFLQAGEAPIGFTAGTANATSHKFFATSVEVCRSSGRRGIMLTQNAAQLPASLPSNVLHVPYAPFKALLPRLAAFVHHGGIGSTSEALRAGVPQLIRPMAYDQFDNASRAVRLGVAREILPRLYKPKAVTKVLAELVDNENVRAHCQKIAKKLATEDGIARACDEILRLHTN